MSERILKLVPHIATKLAEQRARAMNIGGGSCLYRSETGRRCAVGWLLEDNASDGVFSCRGGVFTLLDEYPHALNHVLFDIEDEEVYSLLQVQSYHDNEEYADGRVTYTQRLIECKDKPNEDLAEQIEQDLTEIVKEYMQHE